MDGRRVLQKGESGPNPTILAATPTHFQMSPHKLLNCVLLADVTSPGKFEGDILCDGLFFFKLLFLNTDE